MTHQPEHIPAAPPLERLRFAIVLAQLRLGAIDQGEVAEMIRQREDQISKWVSGKRRPSTDSLRAVADAVGIDWLWLSASNDPRAEEPPEFARWWAGRAARLAAEGVGVGPARKALPTNEELAALTGASVGKPRTPTVRDLEREQAAKHAKKKDGGRRA